MKAIYTNEFLSTISLAIGRKKNEFITKLTSYIESFQKTESLEIVIPKNVYVRTKLICDYIEDSLDVSFQIANFLMLLYVEFLQTALKTYNPSIIYNAITRTHGYNEKLLIHDNEKVYAFKKQEKKQTILTIVIDKKEAEKGRLLLEEIDDLYGQAPSLEKMIGTLWINYIEDYKEGKPHNSLPSIIALLKKHYEL